MASPRRQFQGFDEYMNIVVDQAEEISVKKGTRKAIGASSGSRSAARCSCAAVERPEAHYDRPVPHNLRSACVWLWPGGWTGRILLKGDNITLIQSVQ